MTKSDRESEMESRIHELESEVARLRAQAPWSKRGDTVRVPKDIQHFFDVAQETVRKYFLQIDTDPTKASIQISGERYVLMRASSLSVDFHKTIQNLYADLDDEQAFAVGRNFLFDISHVIGMEDARNFHKRMGVTAPIERLSTGPVHFAYSGWAFVDISPDSDPKPNDEFFMKYDHPFSFEADAWIRAGEKSKHPVCIMNAGYSSGWCEESFGLQLTAVELTCKAKGDETCTFIMAPPHKIEEHLKKYIPQAQKSSDVAHRIPTFFERKRVEEEMNAARQKAEDSDRMKSEFLTNMSHEIRTPMNALIGMTELVLDSQLTNVQREYLNTTLESAESLMSIINQILDFSKIDAGKLELDSNPFSLRECIGDSMKSLAIRAHSKGLELAWNVTPDVPDALRGDPSRLRQIILNLVGNSIKFTAEGEIVVEISLDDEADDFVLLHVEVRDTGIGIPEEKREAIFQAFSQGDMSTTREFGGTGLGLTISAKLVERMKGRVWVESELGSGTTFHFTARMLRDQAVTAKHSELVDQQVLVAADKPTNRKILLETLQNLGMQVGTVESAQAALKKLLEIQSAGEELPLLIADTVNELGLIKAIRKRPLLQTTRIIALAPGHIQNELEQLDNLAVEAWLIKPIKQSELIAAIKQSHLSALKNKSTVIPETPLVSPKVKVVPAEKKRETKSSGIKILLVEDGITNQKFAVAMLSRWGHAVAIANNGREALEKLQVAPDYYDIVLMDVLMPEMDGLEATAAIREEEKMTGRHIPIIAVTAQAMKGDRERCLDAGMDEYLSKPIRRKELHHAIEKLLD